MKPFYNINLELEDREFLAGLPDFLRTYASETVEIPDYIRIENQGRMGSCQGNSVTTGVECALRRRGFDCPELSRIYAYVASQRVNNLHGKDQGSTISAGCKLASTVGFPTEALLPYPARYPDRRKLDQILRDGDAADERYKTETLYNVPRDHRAIRQFIAGGGVINLGISWAGIPRDRNIRRWSGGRGGHAIVILGYDPDRYHVMNSHGDGTFYIWNDAFYSMLDHRYTAAIGMAAAGEPNFDWYKGSPWLNLGIK